ncbi:MAG: SH3 domain-containing protein [Syntrophaceae bacterium]
MRRIFFGRNLMLLLCFILASGCAATKTTTKPATTSPTAPTSTTGFTPKPVILYVISDRLNLRECPSLQCKVAVVLKLGDEVIVLGQKQDWINVRVKATHQEGWVAAYLVGETPRERTPSRIKEEPSPRAKEKQGQPELKEEFSP